MARIVRIVESDIKGPYNILDLPDGKSVTFIATDYKIGRAVREIVADKETKRVEGPIMRIFADLSTPVLGAPYLDVLAGKTIALLDALFKSTSLPVKITITASGVEPEKYYVITYEQLPKKS